MRTKNVRQNLQKNARSNQTNRSANYREGKRRNDETASEPRVTGSVQRQRGKVRGKVQESNGQRAKQNRGRRYWRKKPEHVKKNSICDKEREEKTVSLKNEVDSEPRPCSSSSLNIKKEVSETTIKTEGESNVEPVKKTRVSGQKNDTRQKKNRNLKRFLKLQPKKKQKRLKRGLHQRLKTMEERLRNYENVNDSSINEEFEHNEIENESFINEDFGHYVIENESSINDDYGHEEYNALNIPEGLPEELIPYPERYKYWFRREELFSHPEARIDPDSWPYVTPEKIAIATAKYCASRTNGVVLDPFCGSGGNTIQFAHLFKRVIAVDIDPVKIANCIHNAELYNVRDKITFINDDFWNITPHLKNIDLVFLSPPWGGVDYKKDIEKYDIEKIQPLGGTALFRWAQSFTKDIAFFLPKMVDRDQVRNLVAEDENVVFRFNCVKRNRPKAVTAYFGNLARKITNQYKTD